MDPINKKMSKDHPQSLGVSWVTARGLGVILWTDLDSTQHLETGQMHSHEMLQINTGIIYL